MTTRGKATGAIVLYCLGCKRKISYPRKSDPLIPSRVTRIETSHCDRCDNGDFGSETWLDVEGNEVDQC